MIQLLKTRFTLVWLLLVAATFAGWEVGREEDGAIIAYAAIIAIALFKVRFVVMEFMELRHAPWPFRLIFDLWAILLWGGLVAMPRLVAG